MISIGIILVSYCGVQDTTECVRSLLRTYRDNVHLTIVVVDNASPENKVTFNVLRDVALPYKPNCKAQSYKNNNKISVDAYCDIILISSKKNSGFGAGNNIGIRILKELSIDYAILLNNDTIVPEDFIKKMLITFKDYNTPVAISPKSINYYNKKIDSEGFGYIDMITGRSSHIIKYSTAYLVGSCIMMNYVKDIPYFDEKFFLYCEDVDYSFKLSALGYSLKYDKDNCMYHKVSASTSKNKKMEFIKILSLKYLVHKHCKIHSRFLFYLTRSLYYIGNFKFAYLKVLWT